MPRLVVFHGDRPEQYVELTDRDLRIGRVAENDLVLSDPEKTVSRYHAELRFENNRYALIDLNSQNGIWQDGKRVQKAVLEPGRPVSLGLFRLVLEDSRSFAATVATASPSLQETRIVDPMMLPPQVPPGIPPPAPAPPPVPPPVAGAEPLPQKGKARRPLASNQPSVPAPNIISRIAQPKVFFGIIGLMVLLVIGRLLFEPATTPPATTPPATGGEQTGARETNDELIARYLADGRRRMEQGDLDAAIDEFSKALIINPDHPQALELKIKAEEQRRTPSAQPAAPTAATNQPRATPQPGGSAQTTKPQPPATPPPGGSAQATKPQPPATTARPTDQATPPPRRPRPTPPPAENASTQLLQEFERARALLVRGQFAEALTALEAVQKKSPGYGNVEALIAEARAGRRQEAVQAMEQGNALVTKGDLPGALRQYARAQSIDGSLPGLAQAVDRVRSEMTAAGEQAYRRARQYDALGRGSDALPLYEQALQLLPQGHANRQAAEERVAALKAAPR